MDLDPSLAFTALINLWPGFRDLEAREGQALTAELSAGMTQENPKDRWAYAREWIADRQPASAPARSRPLLACCADAPHFCPGCGRVMSHREAAELGRCDDGGCA